MKRRLLFRLGSAAALFALRGAAAQSPREARVGLLSFAGEPEPGRPDVEAAFVTGMRERGYIEGRNLVIERRYGRGQPERLAAAAAELVRIKVDVILAAGPAPLTAAIKATRSIAIVSVGGSDPVAEGWAASLARPGGNVTGLTVAFPEVGPKQLELLKEALPRLKRAALMFAPAELGDWRRLEPQMLAGARQLGLELQLLPLRQAQDIDAAFDAARTHAAQALLALSTNLIVTQRARLAAQAIELRLPTLSDFPLMAQSGFLMSYGADLADLADLLRRAAGHVDRILKGTPAGDLPIERPTKLSFVINQQTARAIGVTLPLAVLLRADEVIE